MLSPMGSAADSDELAGAFLGGIGGPFRSGPVSPSTPASAARGEGTAIDHAGSQLLAGR